MVTARMAGRGSAAFLVWYWSLPSWSGWLAAWVSADRPPRRDILYGTRASGLAMIRHLIEQPAGWCRSAEIVGTPNTGWERIMKKRIVPGFAALGVAAAIIV